MAAYNKMTKDEIKAKAATNPPALGGVEQSKEVLEVKISSSAALDPRDADLA